MEGAATSRRLMSPHAMARLRACLQCCHSKTQLRKPEQATTVQIPNRKHEGASAGYALSFQLHELRRAIQASAQCLKHTRATRKHPGKTRHRPPDLQQLAKRFQWGWFPNRQSPRGRRLAASPSALERTAQTPRLSGHRSMAQR